MVIYCAILLIIILWFNIILLVLDSKRTMYMIELWSSVIPYVVIEHVTKFHELCHLFRCSIMTHDWMSWPISINPIPCFDLIRYILWFGLIISSLWSDLINSYYFIQFYLFDKKCSFLHLPMEGGERHSQSHSGEYYCLLPNLTWNTQGCYIPIFPVAVFIITPPG